MTALAVRQMTGQLTVPFARGADTLSLTLTSNGDPAQATVEPYDFADHVARFQREPEPQYLLVVRRDVPEPMSVTVAYRSNGGTDPTVKALRIPAGTLAGTSFALKLGSVGTPDLRLLQLRMTPAPPLGSAAEWWGLVALLGNMAKLLWAVGWERDQIRRRLSQVRAQRRRAMAVGRSLDLQGYDLGVPRFPPLPYSLDEETIALYHLDDEPDTGQEEVTVVQDSMGNYPDRAGYPGRNEEVRRARSRARGRFGHGFAFNARSEIRITHTSDDTTFNLGMDKNFTVECFVKPNADRPPEREWHVLSKHANLAKPNWKGWVLSIGEFGRGLPLNARFLLRDGAVPVNLFVDASLTRQRFYHLAGVIDRNAGQARLYLDGELRDTASIAGLGALTNQAAIRLGREAADLPADELQGIIDEVRFSNVARSTFNPVIGEDDDSYRRRLGLFERWTVPSRANLTALLNAATGPIQGDPEPLVVNDVDAPVLSGSHTLTIYPKTIGPGVCIDAAGNRYVQEAEVSGTAAAELTFDPAYLVERFEEKMQLVAAKALDALLVHLDDKQKHLTIERAYDSKAEDLHAVGRALVLKSTNKGELKLEIVAAAAHRAGFSYVCHRFDAVYASIAPGDYFEIKEAEAELDENGEPVEKTETITDPDGVQLLIDDSAMLILKPQPAGGALYNWRVVPCGAGRVNFRLNNRYGQPSELTKWAKIRLAVPGKLMVKVDVTRRGHTVSAAKTFWVIQNLADGRWLRDDGSTVSEAELDRDPIEFFDPFFLNRHDETRVDYGAEPNHHLMQTAVAQKLDRLLTLMDRLDISERLVIVKGYTPGEDSLYGLGRALTLRLTPERAGLLGALAHAAGFSAVGRQGADILVRQDQGELLTITDLAGNPPTKEVSEAGSMNLTISPRHHADPRGMALGQGKVYVANRGTDTVSEIDAVTGRIVRAIRVGQGPVAVALSPNGTRLYSADARSQTVTAIDLMSGNRLATVEVAATPTALLHHPIEERLFVLAEMQIQEINTSTLQTSRQVSLGEIDGGSGGMALTSNGSEIWVTLNQQKQVLVFDTIAFAVAGTIGLDSNPQEIIIIALRADRQADQAYIVLPETNRLAIVDVAERRVIHLVALDHSPNRVAVSSDGSTVAVITQDLTKKKVYYVEILEPDGTKRGRVPLLTGSKPTDLVADSNRVYVTGQIRIEQKENGEEKTTSDEENGEGKLISDVVIVIDPNKAVMQVVDVWLLGSGLGERISWVLAREGGARARLSSTTRPEVTLSGEQAGPVRVRALLVLGNKTAPYTFEVRLKPSLEKQPDVIIRKDQYDRIMNILTAFHPIGVEVNTRALRERVIEVRGQLLNTVPDYTYPKYRVRGPVPRRPRKQGDSNG